VADRAGSARTWPLDASRAARGSSARASRTAAWPSCWDHQHAVRERRHALGVRPVYKRVDTCAAEFATRPPTCTPPTRRSARPSRPPQEDHGAGRRPQPHRPGHRVRLLLRARGAGDARGRLRDHHGQLQPGDRVDRLRHQRPPVLRAGDAGRRAGNRRQGKAAGRDRAVRRPDAA
jgi:hypothetical protein